MIINTGGRTDTVQYYTGWLLNRFSEGYVLSHNPLFPNKVTRYELTPDKVDCVVFCLKNYKPILPRLHEIFRAYSGRVEVSSTRISSKRSYLRLYS